MKFRVWKIQDESGMWYKLESKGWLLWKYVAWIRQGSKTEEQCLKIARERAENAKSKLVLEFEL